jgi:hypothetical protein
MLEITATLSSTSSREMRLTCSSTDVVVSAVQCAARVLRMARVYVEALRGSFLLEDWLARSSDTTIYSQWEGTSRTETSNQAYDSRRRR